MEKLNKERVNQIEALRLVDEKMNQEYADFISFNSNKIKIVCFNVYLAIEEGSVMGSVYFEEVGKLIKTPPPLQKKRQNFKP